MTHLFFKMNNLFSAMTNLVFTMTNLFSTMAIFTMTIFTTLQRLYDQDPVQRDDLAAARAVLKKHSMMLLTASKAYVRCG